MTDVQYRYIWDPDTKMVVKIDMPTLRDQFAMAALSAIIQGKGIHTTTQAAETAYHMADAMMEARK